MSSSGRSNVSIQVSLNRANTEKKRLQSEEKAIKDMMASLRAQSTQLQVEALELRARDKENSIRVTNKDLAEDDGTEPRRTRRISGPLKATAVTALVVSDPSSVNREELQLGVGVLDQMMHGQFRTEAEEEEEEDSE